MQKAGVYAHFYETLRDALASNPDLAFARWTGGDSLPGILEGLQSAHQRKEPIPVIVLVQPGDATAENRARENKAKDILSFPPSDRDIKHMIEKHLLKDNPDAIIKFLLIGEDPKFLECVELFKSVAGSETKVLLLGETGTGKGNFAMAIHLLSRRKNGPMVAVYCAALSELLLESELFGHEKGAFTGAIARRIGKFEHADGGTIFLDEIGDVAMPGTGETAALFERPDF